MESDGKKRLQHNAGEAHVEELPAFNRKVASSNLAARTNL
jgi:hypothetical protein